MRKLITSLFFASAVLTPAAAVAGPSGGSIFNLRVEVPLICRIAFDSALQDSGDGSWELGRTRELCNSGDGYFVTATYAPDSLVGAVMQVGGREVVLDGSGQAIVYAASGAANVSRNVAITPGEGGFDTDVLTFAIQAA